MHEGCIDVSKFRTNRLCWALVFACVCFVDTLRFHHAFRADEWLLYDMQSPAASGARGLAFGRFFTRDGKLIVTTAQEGLIRVRSSKADAAAAAAKKRTMAAATDAGTAAAATGSKSDKMLITKRWTSAGPSATDYTQAPPRNNVTSTANAQLPSKL